jgi:hypothetical protein
VIYILVSKSTFMHCDEVSASDNYYILYSFINYYVTKLFINWHVKYSDPLIFFSIRSKYIHVHAR